MESAVCVGFLIILCPFAWLVLFRAGVRLSHYSSGTKMLLRFPEAITHWVNDSLPGLNSDQEVNS